MRKATDDRLLLKEELSVETFDLIAKRLTDEAAEMFQWVNLQIEHLCQYDREQDIVVAIRDKPLATLGDTYAMVLEHILNKSSTTRNIAIKTISWLLHMKEALPPSAFINAVFERASGPDLARNIDELLTICSSLVLFDSQCQTFRFSHQSVQDFLRTNSMFSAESAQIILAETCLTACSNGPPTEELGSKHDKLDELYRYAALYWPYHSSKAISTEGGQSITENVVSFVYDEPGDVSLSFLSWLEVIEVLATALADEHPMKAAVDATPNSRSSPLFIASVFGLNLLLEHEALGTESVDWDQRNSRGHTSLYLACAAGREATVKFLLDHGASPSIFCGKFGNALQAACFAGHNSVVQALLGRGVSVHERGTFKDAIEACFRGQQENTALILLEHGSSIRTLEDFESVLFGAAENGFLHIIERLNKSSFASRNDQETGNKVKLKVFKAIQGCKSDSGAQC